LQIQSSSADDGNTIALAVVKQQVTESSRVLFSLAETKKNYRQELLLLTEG
jgi:hypothetical protein